MSATSDRLRDRIRALAREDPCPEAFIVQTGRLLAEELVFDGWCLFTCDPESTLPTGGAVEGFPHWACRPFWDNELQDADFNKFNVLARSHDPVAVLSETTDGDLGRSPRHRRIYQPMGVVDELRAVFCDGSACWGCMVLVRSAAAGSFEADEAQLVRDLVPQITCGLRQSVLHSTLEASASAAAVVILGPDGRIASMTDGASAWVEELVTEGGLLELELPTVITVAASRARRGTRPTRGSMRSRGRSGRWFVIDAAPLEAADGEGQVAVTIQPARPGDLLPILLEAYGFTDRELQIVVMLARGLATKQIARQLYLSPHTVRDHLKAIFDKAGVNSRGELVGKLFSEQLLESVTANISHASAAAPAL
jgi:DNA-binding CsgD family transcriptional regulator